MTKEIKHTHLVLEKSMLVVVVVAVAVAVVVYDCGGSLGVAR